MKRPGVSNFRYLLVAAVIAVLIVCGIFLFAPSKTADRSEPNIDALKQILERSAEVALPLPSVSDDRIVLHAEPSRFDSEIERVIGVATDLGGTALQGAEDEVLAQIPIEKVPEFFARVTRKEAPVSGTNQAGGEATQLIVVNLKHGGSSAQAETGASP
jgi:hypothetical protein